MSVFLPFLFSSVVVTFTPLWCLEFVFEIIASVINPFRFVSSFVHPTAAYALTPSNLIFVSALGARVRASLAWHP